MVINLTVDDLDVYPPSTKHELTNLFIRKILMYLRRYNVKEIITNSQISMILQDNSSFIFDKLNNNIIQYTADPYLVGTIYDVLVKVDPQMRWNDNRILPKDSMLRLRKEKIFKILKKKKFEDFIEEIVIDEKLINMLV